MAPREYILAEEKLAGPRRAERGSVLLGATGEWRSSHYLLLIV